VQDLVQLLHRHRHQRHLQGLLGINLIYINLLHQLPLFLDYFPSHNFLLRLHLQRTNHRHQHRHLHLYRESNYHLDFLDMQFLFLQLRAQQHPLHHLNLLA
jgi:hypothetical protein